MASKKIEIEVGVKTDQLDQATNKVGELKKLSNTISIQYDIDGKPIDVVINKSLNLKKQVVELTKSLRSVKEGTTEFKLLSTALGDAQDKLAQSNAKSRDLLGSLQLIPGPIGQIASQLNGAISVLKTFSSFSLKDVQFQFKETFNDIKDIGKGFLGLNKGLEDTNTNTTKTSDNLGNITQSASSASNATKQLSEQTSIYNKATGDLMVSQNIQIREFPKMVNGVEQLTYAVRSADGSYRTLTASEITAMKSGQALQLNQEGQIVTTVTLTAATRGLTIALNLLKVAFGGLLITAVVYALVAAYDAIKEWITGAKAAEEENIKLAGSFKALQDGIKDTEDIIKVNGQVLLNEAKKRGASIEELTKIERKNLDDRVQANKDARKLLIREEERLIANSLLNEEQRKERLKEIDDAIAENSNKAGDLRLERILFESNSELSISKKKQDDLMKDLDARIKLEIDKENTSSVALKNLLDLKLSLRKKYEGLAGNELKVAAAENTKILNDALNTDSKRIETYYAKIDQIANEANQDEQKREETARIQKLNQDILALTYDEDFLRASEEEKGEIRKNLETKYDRDILDIKDKFFKEKYKKEQEAFLKEQELRVKNKENELAVNQQRIDGQNDFNTLYGDFIFGTKGLKAMYEKNFIDLREVYQQEYDNDVERFRQDEELLKEKLDNKGITQKTYDEQIIQLNEKRTASAEKNTAKQIELDKLEVDSKRASADMTIQVGEKLVGLLSGIAGKNIKLQKAAAILDAGVSIARVITDTSRAIIAFSASVAPLGPAGVPIAAAYSVKAKISAGLAIATIIASGIGKLKSLDENSLSSEGGGGQQSSSTTRGMARGGMIGGKRHAQGGTMIEAEQGEAVLTRGAVSMFGPMLSMMNQAGGGVSFNSNLMTTRQDNPILSNPAQDQAPIVVKTYVVEKDMVSQINKQARLKDLSTL